MTSSPTEGHPRPALVSAAMGVLLAACGTAWLLQDTVAPMWDQSRHAWNTLRLLTLLGGVARAPWRLGDVAVWHDQQYAVGGYLLPALLQAVTGPSLLAVQLVSVLVWTPLLLAAMHVAAVRWTTLPWAGPAAVAWVASAPMLIDFSKDIMLDLPIVSLSACVWAAAGKGAFVFSRRQSVLTGLALGALLLTKAVVPVTFVLPPLLWGACALRDRSTRANVLRNLGWTTLCAVVVAGPYYSKALPEFLSLLQGQARDAASEGDPQGYLDSLRLYAGWWPRYHVHALQLPWLLLGLVAFFRREKTTAGLVLLGILFPLLVWPLFPNKDPRYVLGWVVAGGVASSFVVQWHRLTALAGAVWMASMTALVLWGSTENRTLELAGVPVLRTYGYLRGAPLPNGDSPRALMATVHTFVRTQLTQHAWRRPMLLVTDKANEPHFNTWNLTYNAYAMDRVVEVLDRETAPQDTELRITTHCNGVTPPDDTAAWVPLGVVPTPRGCVAVAWWNAPRVAAEATLYRAPLGPWPWTYALGRQTQTVVALSVEPQPWTAGQPAQVTLATRVDVNRRPDTLVHVLSLDGTVLAQWTTTDDNYTERATYLAFPRFVLPANILPGPHPLTYTVRASGDPGMRYDDGAVLTHTVLVGNVQVQGATPPE